MLVNDAIRRTETIVHQRQHLAFGSKASPDVP
jgi:hypothetical protein